MTDIIPARSHSVTLSRHAEKVVQKLDSLTVEETDIAVSRRTERQISLLHAKDVVPLLSGVVVVATATPTIFYAIAPELYYTVPAMIGMTVFSLGWIGVLGRKLNTKIDESRNVLLRKYVPEVSAWLNDQGVSFDENTLVKVTDIITGHDYHASGRSFRSMSGEHFAIVYDKHSSSWFMKEAEGLEEEPSQHGFPALSFLPPELLDTVHRKITILRSNVLTAEERHAVESIARIVTESAALAEELHALDDKNFIKDFAETLSAMNEELNEIMSVQRQHVRSRIQLATTFNRKDIE